MPVTVNLYFTVLIWILFIIIFFSNRKSKVNQWCFISGMVFSIGVLKEYYFYDLLPAIHFSLISVQQLEAGYSVMTAFLYTCATPCALMFGFYVSGLPLKYSKFFTWVKRAIVIAAVILLLVYPPNQFRHFQLNSFDFWITVSVYNLFYGFLLTVLMIAAIIHDKNPMWKKQKRQAAILTLPLLWYWLITIFIIHSMQIKPLFHAWEGNVAMLSVMLVYFFISAFREGIMGIKLDASSFQWDSEMRSVHKGTQYMNHILKNETAKIEWCASNLSSKTDGEISEEIKIILRSTERLKNLVQRIQFYSKDIELHFGTCNMLSLIERCVDDAKSKCGKDFIAFETNVDKDLYLRCDSWHVSELMNNLLNNSIEAVGAQGMISIDFKVDKREKLCVLSVGDNGKGINKNDIAHLFEPYQTTKGSDHLGLGLFYCARVINKHNGSIHVKSEEGRGTTFFVYFPYSLYRNGLKKGEEDEGQQNLCHDSGR